jgi:hypothetical protein
MESMKMYYEDYELLLRLLIQKIKTLKLMLIDL